MHQSELCEEQRKDLVRGRVRVRGRGRGRGRGRA